MRRAVKSIKTNMVEPKRERLNIPPALMQHSPDLRSWNAPLPSGSVFEQLATQAPVGRPAIATRFAEAIVLFDGLLHFI
jgi:hypothetical protein